LILFKEAAMSRVINPDSAGKERTQLTKSIVLAVRQLARQADVDDLTRDLASYISLALFKVDATIDISVQAWEKRGYWVKADKFRMEWLWTGQYAAQMKQAVLADDWAQVAALSVQTGQRLAKIKIAEHHRLGTPWVGAYKKLLE
jgi:hypothetical protein